MALGQEDLRFVMTVDPDTAKMQTAIKDIGRDMDNQVKSLKSSWDALSASGAKQLESIEANRRISEGFVAKKIPDVLELVGVINLREEAEKRITKDMGEQLALIERIKAESDPDVLRQRVALEKQIADARKDYLGAHSAEAARQGLPSSPKFDISNPIGSIKALAIAALGEVGATLAAVATGAGSAAYALKLIVSAISGFVAVASPGAFRQWEFVLRDVSGVIGQTLIPVLALMRDGMRLFGDVLANILPSTQEMAQALAPLREAFGDLARDIRVLLAEIGPTIRYLVTSALANLATELSLVAKATDNAVWALRHLVPILGFLGGSTEARSSVGAAARAGGIATGEAYQRGNIEAALNASAGQQSVPRQTLGVLERILKAITDNQQKKGSSFAGIAPNQGWDSHGIRRALAGF